MSMLTPIIDPATFIPEGARLEAMGVRAVTMRPLVDQTDPSNPVTTGFELVPEGEQDIVNIWATSCAPLNWPDEAAFRQAVIDAANDSVADPLQPQVNATVFNTIVGNNANAALVFRPLVPIISICIETWWFSIYIWTRI